MRFVFAHRVPSSVAVVTAVAVLAACGSAAPVAEPDDTLPVIEVVGGNRSATSAAADSMMAGGESVAESSKMFAPLEFEYAGDDVDLTGPAPAYRFVPAGPPSDETVRRLADAFGVTGDVSTVPEDQGGGRMVGPSDGSAPNVMVMGDALQTWWYSDPVGSFSAVSCAVAEPVPADSVLSDPVPADSLSPDPAGDVTVPDCVEPQPPADVPSGPEGEQIARDVLAATGVDVGSYEFETYADDWGVSVTAYLVVDGVRSQVSTSVGIGGGGSVTWAGGSLASPERVAEYPRVGVRAAVERLNEQYGGWGVAPRPMPAVVDTGVAVDGSGGGSDGSSGGSGDGSVTVDPMPTPEPMVVRLSAPQPALEQFWGADGVVWLVPAYSFAGDDGGRYTAIALDDTYFQQDVSVASIDPGVVGVAPEPGWSETAPDAAAAPSVVGLTFDEATDVAATAGWSVRAARIDGEDLAVTADYVATRLNVAVEAGVITEVLSVG